MNRQVIKTVIAIIKRTVSEHPATLFSRQAFQIGVNNELDRVIDQAMAELVAQGVVRKLDCSGNPKRAVYCLANEHGGNEAASRQFFEGIVRITH